MSYSVYSTTSATASITRLPLFPRPGPTTFGTNPSPLFSVGKAQSRLVYGLAPLRAIPVVAKSTGNALAFAFAALLVKPITATSVGNTFSSVVRAIPLQSSTVSSLTHASANGTVSAFRTTTITGAVFDEFNYPLPGVQVFAYLKTSGFPATYVNTTSTTVDVVSSTTSDSSGQWTLHLAAPGDLSPSGLYYIFSIKDIIYSTTSFAYSITTISFTDILQKPSTVISANMIGYITDNAGNGVLNTEIIATISMPCYDFVSKCSVLPNSSGRVVTQTDQTGTYILPLLPTNNLIPLGSYYIVQEGTTITPKRISVPSAGGNVNDNIILATTVLGSTGFSVQQVPADVLESVSYNDPPITLQDNEARIRSALTKLLHTNWSTLVQDTLPTLLPVGGTTTGTIQILGGLNTQGRITTPLISGSSPVQAIKIRPEAGLGCFIHTNHTFANDIYGQISWRSGIRNWSAGPQIEIWLSSLFGVHLTGTPSVPDIYFNTMSVAISPADQQTSLQWNKVVPFTQAYQKDQVSFNTSTKIVSYPNINTGKFVIYVVFSNSDNDAHDYTIYYKIDSS